MELSKPKDTKEWILIALTLVIQRYMKEGNFTLEGLLPLIQTLEKNMLTVREERRVVDSLQKP
jgi:hypothetical protein